MFFTLAILNDFFASLFGNNAMLLIFAPFFEEVAKRFGTKWIRIVRIAMFCILETLTYALEYNSLDVAITRCVLTNPMHFTASRLPVVQGILFHAGFNLVTIAIVNDGRLLPLAYVYVAVGTLYSFIIKKG